MTVVSNSNAGSLVWSTYVDVNADVVPWLQMPLAYSQTPVVLTNLAVITESVCQWVQNYIGRPIAPTSFDRRFNGWSGWNGAYIELPYYPILEIQSVIEYWGVSGPHALSEQTPTNQIDGFQCDYITGRLTRVFPGLVQKPWFPGSRNIEVVWTAGFNPLPGDIKLATLEMIAHWWENTQQKSPNRAPGDFDPSTQAGLWTGVPNRIVDMLSPYIQVGMG